MRIIAGQYKGLVLKAPPGRFTRPTLSRIRENLFNILGNCLSGSFLELYAGSGSVGLEARSRGCEAVTLVEKDQQANKCLELNIAKFKLKDQSIRLVNGDADLYVQQLREKSKFDYIFLDPPYQRKYFEQWESDNGLSAILSDKGMLIAQHPKKITLPDNWAGALLQDQRTYGETKLSFYKKDVVNR